jgi:fibronectin-binding autotransporter adhesin
VWCLLGGVARAQTVYIDQNGTSSGFGVNGTYTWNATNTNWTTSAAGTNTTVTWAGIGGSSSSLVTVNATGSSTINVVGNYTIGGLTKTGSTTSIVISANNSLTFAPNATLTALGGLSFGSLSPLGDFTVNGGGQLRFFQSYSGNITNNSTTIEIGQSNNIFATNMNVNMLGSSQLNIVNAGYVAGIGSLSGNSTSATVRFNGALTVQQTRDETYSGILLGNRLPGVVTAGGESNFTKNGSATLVLAGNNAYAGATIINGGTLSIGTIANGGIQFSGNYVSASTTVNTTSTTGFQPNMTVVSGSLNTLRTTSTVTSGTSFTLTASPGFTAANVASLAGFANGLGISTFLDHFSVCKSYSQVEELMVDCV